MLVSSLEAPGKLLLLNLAYFKAKRVLYGWFAWCARTHIHITALTHSVSRSLFTTVFDVPAVQNHTTLDVDTHNGGTYTQPVDEDNWLLVGFYSQHNMFRDAAGSLTLKSDPHVMFAPSAMVSGYGTSFMSVDRNRFVDRSERETWRYFAATALVQQYGWVKYLNGTFAGKTTGNLNIVLLPASFSVTTTTEVSLLSTAFRIWVAFISGTTIA